MAGHRIVTAINNLWKLAPPGPQSLFATPEFREAKAACQEVHRGLGSTMVSDIALHNALRALGLPYRLAGNTGISLLAPEEAANALTDALTRASANHVILCPLDLADDLPGFKFGPCTVRKFHAKELWTLFQGEILMRSFPEKILDVSKLSEFTWLCIREEVVLPEPGARAAPFFYELLENWGSINPHKSSFLPVVEKALFLLLLEPWEEWTCSEVDWEPFRVPWTYTASDDIFTYRVFPQTSDSLTWEPKVFDDGQGEPEEWEVPAQLPVNANAVQACAASLSDAAWHSLQEALNSPMLKTPIVHFLVRAFASDGIDEFLAHMLVIEAALGLESDYGGERPYKEIRATKRVVLRVSALLGSLDAGVSYGELFNLRSAFLHGRTMNQISAVDRRRARSLARRVAKAILEEAIQGSGAVPRDEFLNSLLHRGVHMKPGNTA